MSDQSNVSLVSLSEDSEAIPISTMITANVITRMLKLQLGEQF